MRTDGPFDSVPEGIEVSDGVYRWNCETDKGTERAAYKITMWVCGGLVLFLILLSALLDLETMMITVLCGVVVMAIAALVCWLFDRLPGTLREQYELTEEHIKIGSSSKTASYISFKSIRRVTVKRDKLEVHRRIVTAHIFVPHEAFRFVRDYILRRIPDTAEVTYDYGE